MCGMNHFQNGSRCITVITKLNPTPLLPGWNLSYQYQRVASRKQHGGHGALVIIVIMMVEVAIVALTYLQPLHTPSWTKSLSLSLFPIKMSVKSQESHGAESLAGLDHSRGLVHREAWWTKGTDKDGHNTPETHTCAHTASLSLSLSRLHAKSSLSLSASGSGIHLQALLLALL